MSDLSSQRLELTPEERQAKLERQKQLMEQKRKQRQMQSGMVMSSGLYRPQSNKYHRFSSRPSSQPSSQPARSSSAAVPGSSGAVPDRPVAASSSAGAVQTEAVDSSMGDGSIPRVLVSQTDEDPPKSKGNADTVAKKLASLGLSPASHYDDSDSSADEIESDPPTNESDVGISPGHEMAIAPSSHSARTKSTSRGAHASEKEGSSSADAATPSAVNGVLDEDTASAALLDIQLDDQGITNLPDLVFQSPPESAVVKCRITRDKHGLDKHMYPIYHLHLEWEAGARLFLLVGRKRKRSRSSNYVISINPTDLTRGGSNYIAKLRSNFVGTVFTLYDRGTNPSKRPSQSASSSVREELCMVHYDTNVLGFKGPRKMDVIIPSVGTDGKRHEVKPTREQETLLERFKFTDMKHLLHLTNKQPIWSEETQAYVLNFHGRVTQASVKNFQLVHESDPDYIVMQFGRISEDCFTMDYRYPLCAVQAFAIALSSFDSKLACE